MTRNQWLEEEASIARRLEGVRTYTDEQLIDALSDGQACAYNHRHRSVMDVAAVRMRQLVEGGRRFADFTRINTARAARWHPGFPNNDEWTIADWSNAVCGEAGEMANVVKKMRRIETGHRGANDPSIDELRAMLAEEIADVYAYLDLLATKCGIDLEEAAIAKFNKVSVREGWSDLQL